jgi:hypothetical protein
MKRFLLILLALVITGSGDAQQMLYNASMQEALLKRNHKVWYIQTLSDSMEMKNGAVVYADGSIRDGTGKVYTMADGDCIKFNGKLVIFYEWIKTIDGIKTTRHIVRVWSILTQPITLQNGIYAMPGGTLKLTTGGYIKMKNKDFMGFDGNGVMALK